MPRVALTILCERKKQQQQQRNKLKYTESQLQAIRATTMGY